MCKQQFTNHLSEGASEISIDCKRVVCEKKFLVFDLICNQSVTSFVAYTSSILSLLSWCMLALNQYGSGPPRSPAFRDEGKGESGDCFKRLFFSTSNFDRGTGCAIRMGDSWGGADEKKRKG